MHGAMIEAVAASGYGRTSVRQVVTLAGVSRRAFYEQFSNKQECFLSTLDLIAERVLAEIAASYRASEGPLEQRLGAALRSFSEIVRANPKGSRVMLVDAPSAGPAGWARLTQMLATFESRLAASFAYAPDAAALPVPVARAIVGGLRRATFVLLVEHRTEQMPAMAEHMLSWIMVFKTGSPSRLAGRPHALGTDARPRGEDERARMLRSALELAALEGYAALTPMRIADEAGVSIDAFFELFNDMEACVLAAVEQLGKEVREVLSDPGLSCPAEWPQAVRRALAALMRHLAANPANAQTIATGLFAMGRRAVDMGAELAREVAASLTAGAPAEPLTALAKEGIEGAIWHTIHSQVARGGTDSLPALSDHLAYVVLAPYIGADEAAEIVTESRSSQAA
jgi:AcrR family transcriptional regulator